MAASARSTLPPAIRDGETHLRPPLQQYHEGNSRDVRKLDWSSLVPAKSRICGAREDVIGIMGGDHPALTAPPVSVRTSIGVRNCTCCSCSDRGRGCCNDGSRAPCAAPAGGSGRRCRSGDSYGGSG